MVNILGPDTARTGIGKYVAHIKEGLGDTAGDITHYAGGLSRRNRLFLKKPCVVTLHGTYQPSFWNHFEYREITDHSHVIVPSQYTKERSIYFYHLHPGKVHVIPHGVDREYLEAEAEPCCQVLHVSNGAPKKRVDMIRKIWPNTHIHIDQSTSEDEMPTLYAAHKVLLFPSLEESFGLPVLEALAAGCQVVCSRNSALKEYFEHVTFQPAVDEPSHYKTMVEAALTAPDLNQGRTYAAEFPWTETIRRTREIYEAALQ